MRVTVRVIVVNAVRVRVSKGPFDGIGEVISKNENLNPSKIPTGVTYYNYG